eukprot:scaffold1933_cov165-Amphora_coffeaeformis.AAC.15
MLPQWHYRYDCDANGDCRWEFWGDHYDENEEDWTSADDKEVEDYIKDYFDWMGHDWRRAAKLGASVFGLGFLLAVAAGVYGCVAHVRPIRVVMGAIALLMASLQFSVLTVLNSDFCQHRNCELARSGHFAIAAGVLYLLAAPGFLWMKNYAPSSSQEVGVATTKAVAPIGVEEATHADDADDNTRVAAGAMDHYNMTHDDVELQQTSTTSMTTSAYNPHDDDGVSAAREIKPATIY